MRFSFKLLLASLLLVLTVAVGTEVVALHRSGQAPLNPGSPPIVVRKSTTVPMPRKSVRSLGHPPGPGPTAPRPRKPAPHRQHNAPAS